MPWKINVDALVWILGRSPEDGSRGPWEIRDVDSDGSRIWLANQSQSPQASVRLVQSTALSVPSDRSDRALLVREILEGMESCGTIWFTSEGGGTLGASTDPQLITGLGEVQTKPVPVVVRRRFKVRKKRR